MDKTDMTAYGLHGQYDMPSEKYKISRILSQEKGLYCIISESGEQLASYKKLKTENAYFENTAEFLEQKKKKFKNIAKINNEMRK